MQSLRLRNVSSIFVFIEPRLVRFGDIQILNLAQACRFFGKLIGMSLFPLPCTSKSASNRAHSN